MINLETLQEIRAALSNAEQAKATLDELIANQFSWDMLIGRAEAEKRYGKQPGALRKAIEYGVFRDGIECKKIGNQWIFRVDALERQYNQSKK